MRKTNDFKCYILKFFSGQRCSQIQTSGRLAEHIFLKKLGGALVKVGGKRNNASVAGAFQKQVRKK